MDEILTSTSEFFPDESNTDLAWLTNNLGNQNHGSNWRNQVMSEEFFSEDSSQDTVIRRPRKLIF